MNRTLLLEHDNCTRCLGTRGGTCGNENIINERILCDYCTADERREEEIRCKNCGNELSLHEWMIAHEVFNCLNDMYDICAESLDRVHTFYLISPTLKDPADEEFMRSISR